MAEQQSPAPAQTLNQVNADFLTSRATRLDTAITKALESKLPPAPKAGKPAAPKAAGAAASADPAPVAGAGASAEPSDADLALAAVGAGEAEEYAGEPAGDEPQDEATGGPETPAELAELKALGEKADLRALEKKLGLKEGVLGVKNGDWAAYRRREGELDARVAAEDTRHESNNRTLIGKFGPTVELVELAGKGNLTAYAASIERTTGLPIAQFVALWAKNVRQVDPQTLAVMQENAQLKARLGEGQPPEVKQEPAPAKKEAALQKATTYVTEQIATHPAAKLKGGPAEVRDKWLASFQKSSNSFKLTPQQAADAVLADRRAAREQESWILSGKTPPKAPRTRAISRTGASESQPRKQTFSREELIERAAANIQRSKARERAQQRR